MSPPDACAIAPCRDCVLGCTRTPAPTDAQVSLGASGVAIAVLGGVLWVTAGGWEAGPAAATALAGTVTATVAVVARLRGGAGGLDGVGVRLLAGATAMLLVAFLARLVAVVT